MTLMVSMTISTGKKFMTANFYNRQIEKRMRDGRVKRMLWGKLSNYHLHTCRCRLLSSTISSSTIPRQPTMRVQKKTQNIK